MISIREVAKRAEVSPSTVSRVMNETANVDHEKKLRVLKVIEETGFRPNEVARALYKKSSRIIGMIMPNIENPFFNEMAKAIEKEAYESGYRLTLCNSDDNAQKEIENINMLNRMNADGIILMTNSEEVNVEIQKCKIPIVVLDRKLDTGRELSYLEADHYRGGCIATRHLIECGCRNMVHLSGPQEYSSARQRYEGYRDICREYNRKPDYIDCLYSFEDGIIKTRHLLERFPDTDGIVAGNDMVGISVYKVLQEKGITVPGQIQIIGFDNINLSRLVTPELTTVAQPIAEMGTEAARMIIQNVEGKPMERMKIFPVTLIERGTTIKRVIL